jgi:hypothetical protein
MKNRKSNRSIGASMASLGICFFLAMAAGEALAQDHDPACIRRCSQQAHDACMDATNEKCYRESSVSCDRKCPPPRKHR